MGMNEKTILLQKRTKQAKAQKNIRFLSRWMPCTQKE